MKKIRVGTFFHSVKRGRRPRVSAYTMWYDPSWAGCIEYVVEAENGTEAKKIAIKKRRRHEEENAPDG